MKPGRNIAVSQSSKSGLPPGALIHVGERDPAPTTIRYFRYNTETIEEQFPENPGEFSTDEGTKAWIKVSGLRDLETIKDIGELLTLHPLTTEDILNTGQRPKYEDFGRYLFLVIKTLRIERPHEQGQTPYEPSSGVRDLTEGGDAVPGDDDRYVITAGQLSIVLTETTVCSFEEAESPIFDSIITRLFDRQTRIRQYGPDFLMYALTDCVVDNYYVVFEQIGEEIEALEEGIIDGTEEDAMEQIYTLKRNLLTIRKQIWPARETIAGLIRDKPDLISPRTEVFFNDVSDHLHQLYDMLESYREMATGLYEIYLSTLSTRMNEVMKVLTIIATIFIPLTFIAGIYGMNFAVMPELGWQHGYPAVMLVMAVIAGIMVIYFRKKQWI